MTMEMAPLLLGLVTSLAKDIVAGSVRAALAARADLVEARDKRYIQLFPGDRRRRDKSQELDCQ